MLPPPLPVIDLGSALVVTALTATLYVVLGCLHDVARDRRRRASARAQVE